MTLPRPFTFNSARALRVSSDYACHLTGIFNTNSRYFPSKYPYMQVVLADQVDVDAADGDVSPCMHHTLRACFISEKRKAFEAA